MDNERLSPLEARILGVLVEKERTTPDVYPLTLNSLVAGCNQKTSRDPVMNVSESEVLAALEELRRRLLVVESYGASGRVLRYAHNFAKYYGIPQPSVVLLAVLMLRGALTVNELRANCERLYRFDDASSVEAFLVELAERANGGLAVRLPRAPGAREARWAHLLCGTVDVPSSESAAGTNPGGGAVLELEARVERLETELYALRQEFQALLARLNDAGDAVVNAQV